MKQLLLLRHGKSSWADLALADFDRPLAPRGEKAARRIGRELADLGWLPERVLVSAARRTRDTWAIVSAEWPAVSELAFLDQLYEAPAAQLLAEVQRTPDRIGTLLLLGHNPGLEDLARGLMGEGSDSAAMEKLREKFPTAGLARFEFDTGWGPLRLHDARLTHCLRPNDLD
jgi:phosphohistidine phosphatase